MAMKQTLSEKWARWKPVLGGLVIGLVLGPFLSSYMGWQVTTGTMQDRVENAAVRIQAEVCEWRARRNVDNPSALGSDARRDVAEKYALMPWEDEGERHFRVVTECASQLTQEAPSGASAPRA